MTMRKIIFWLLALGALVSGTALAAPFRIDNPENRCAPGDFPTMSDDYQMATVLQSRSLMLEQDYRDASGACPKRLNPNCTFGSPIPKGRTVIVSDSYHEFVCVFDPISHATGWLEASGLRVHPQSSSRPSDWFGRWSDGYDTITIKYIKGGDLWVQGTAVWGAGTRQHFGEVDYKGKPDGSRLVFLPKDEEGCALELISLGHYLVVRDNRKCGGANVEFRGVYRRTARGKSLHHEFQFDPDKNY